MVSAGCDWWGGRDWAVPASGSLDLEFLGAEACRQILQRETLWRGRYSDTADTDTADTGKKIGGKQRVQRAGDFRMQPVLDWTGLWGGRRYLL